MDKLGDLPIDWANVNWPYVIALVLLVFVCTVIGTSLSFRRTFLGSPGGPTAALIGETGPKRIPHRQGMQPRNAATREG
jgi:hypothetical protein